MQAGKVSDDAAEHCGDVCRVRAKIAALEIRCELKCPGWAVFDANRGFELERCDHCWSKEPDPLMDDELELLPEAQAELALANKDGDGYRPPVFSAVPCVACGCTIWRDRRCCGCSAEREAWQFETEARVCEHVARATDEQARIGRHLEELARAGWKVTTSFHAGSYVVILVMDYGEHTFSSESLAGALAKAVGG